MRNPFKKSSSPISAAILVLVAGVLAGGIGFLVMYLAKNTAISKEESSL
jgi:hypothetical protein